MTMTASATRPTTQTTEWALAFAGLVIGIVLGQIGNFVAAPVPQALFHGLSSIGLAVASALLAVHFAREGATLVAVGFGMLVVAEMLILVGGIEGAGVHASFAAATTYYVPALALISIPGGLNLFARITGVLSAVAFAGHSGSHLLGHQPAPDGPFAIAGYVLLTLAVIGWIAYVVGRKPTADDVSSF